ncbi:MAG: VWA domain-containing protein, partial [Acidobacteria bacterium]|nr:VWA domain-containing protein [Acidobacteriota bacterium]
MSLTMKNANRLRRGLLACFALVALLSAACATAQKEGEIAERRVPLPSNATQTNTNSSGIISAEGGERAGRNTESYSKIDENPFLEVARAPLSTFSIDVDTASYSNTRRFLTEGRLPPKDAVRIEELVNYFSYEYPQPTGSTPFSVTAEVADCPWNAQHRLVHVGLQGRRVASENLPPANLVFLVDVSGSMNGPLRLPLVKSSLRALAEQLTARDRVAIAVYAGTSGLVLPSTPGDRREEILAAIDRLEAGGSTNGGEGIQLAYRVAGENFIKGGVNRVVLATDGDFNVGVTSETELVRLIEEKRGGGVFLSVLGFGRGNLKDSAMENLADKGNGNYAYIDSPAEARKVLGEQVGGTLFTIAKDVKIQVEFNPRLVAGYRLIGYENRLLRDEDFNDDRKDAGEIGAGHTVTALYEVVPAGQRVENPGVDDLKYQQQQQQSSQPTGGANAGELLTVKLRYKAPDGVESQPLNVGVVDSKAAYQNASENFKFASAVAEFGMLLRDSRYKAQSSYEGVLQLARASMGADLRGYRSEFVRLVETAQSLSARGMTN